MKYNGYVLACKLCSKNKSDNLMKCFAHRTKALAVIDAIQFIHTHNLILQWAEIYKAFIEKEVDSSNYTALSVHSFPHSVANKLSYFIEEIRA